MGLLLAAAYSCLQDWDAFLLFSYEPGDPRLSLAYGDGLFTINTPRTRSAVGRLADAGPVDLGGRRANRLEAKLQDGRLQINLAVARSIWCEVLVE